MFPFKRKPVLQYAPVSKQDEFNPFVTIKSLVPKWYKEHPLLHKDDNKHRLPRNPTVKGCVPFLDAMTVGYALVTLCDIGVTQTKGEPHLTWSPNVVRSWRPDGVELIEARDNETLPEESVPYGYSRTQFAIWINAVIKVPKGYATLWTHPLNREDLPFRTLNAIVDGGYPQPNGKCPLFIRKGFEGIIPKGTPIVQVIPFKLDSWTSEKNLTLIQEAEDHEVLGWSSSINPRYKFKYWTKKTYN